MAANSPRPRNRIASHSSSEASKSAARAGNTELDKSGDSLQKILQKLEKLNKLDAPESKINELGTLEFKLESKLCKLDTIDSRMAHIEESVQNLPQIMKRLEATEGGLDTILKEQTQLHQQHIQFTPKRSQY